MGPKRVVKARWKCKRCAKATSAKGKVCMVCSSRDTVIKGMVKKAKKTVLKARKRPAPSRMGWGRCAALGKALGIEAEGREFYLRCAQDTSSPEGKDMFTYLANEEKKHYDRIAQLYEREDYAGYCGYVEAKGLSSGIFGGYVKGGNLDERSDALSALNVGIKAEDRSISLYSGLAKGAETDELKALFERLIAEERAHRNILENEVEFVTGTGQFRDFTAVTM